MGVRFLMYGFWGDTDIHSVPCRLELFLPYLIRSLSQLCLPRSYECFPRRASLRSQRNWQLSLLRANSKLTYNSAVSQSNLFSSLTSCSCLTVDVQTTRTRAIEFHRKERWMFSRGLPRESYELTSTLCDTDFGFFEVGLLHTYWFISLHLT